MTPELMRAAAEEIHRVLEKHDASVDESLAILCERIWYVSMIARDTHPAVRFEALSDIVRLHFTRAAGIELAAQFLGGGDRGVPH